MPARTNTGGSSRTGAEPSALVRDPTAAGSERRALEPASPEATEWELQRTLGNHALAAAAGAPPADARARSSALQMIVSRSATVEAGRLPAKRAPQSAPGRGRAIFPPVTAAHGAATTGRVQRHERKPDPEDMSMDAVAIEHRKPWTLLPSMSGPGLNSPTPMMTYKQWRGVKKALREVMPPPKRGEAKDYRDERLDQLDRNISVVPRSGMPKEGAEDYSKFPAKVYADGRLIFNWQSPEYFNADGTPNQNKIISTVIHECLHALSVNHTGLQAKIVIDKAEYSDETTDPKNSIDEAVTDTLAMEVYSKVFGDAGYETGYLVTASAQAEGADPRKVAIAKKNALPIGWTGDLLRIAAAHLDVPGVAAGPDPQVALKAKIAAINEMYFHDAAAFARLITPARQKAIGAAWTAHLDQSILARHAMIDQRGADRTLQVVLGQILAQRMGQLQSTAERNTFRSDAATVPLIRAQLRAARVPEYHSADLKAPTNYVFSDDTLKDELRKRIEALPPAIDPPEPEAEALPPPPPGMGLPPPPPAMGLPPAPPAMGLPPPPPNVAPLQPGPDLGAPPPAPNMGLPPPPPAMGLPPPPPAMGLPPAPPQHGGPPPPQHAGPPPPAAPGRAGPGLRAAPAFDRRALEAQIGYTPIDPAMVRECMLAVDLDPAVQVMIVQAPAYFVSRTGKFDKTRASTPVGELPQDAVFGIAEPDRAKSTIDLMYHYQPEQVAAHADRAEEKRKKGSAVIDEFMAPFGGAAYDAIQRLIVITARVFNRRTLLHELGHLAQEVRGARPEDQHHEHNVARLILEYHNFLKYENRDTVSARREADEKAAAQGPAAKPEPIVRDRQLRTAYNVGDATEGHTLGKSWAEFTRDLQKLGAKRAHSQTLVAEILEILKQPLYKGYAEVIKSNLVAEYFKHRAEEPDEDPAGAVHDPAAHGHPGMPGAPPAPGPSQPVNPGHVSRIAAAWPPRK